MATDKKKWTEHTWGDGQTPEVQTLTVKHQAMKDRQELKKEHDDGSLTPG